MQDLRQSPEFARYMEKIGWVVEECKIKNLKCKIFIKKLPLIGSFIKIQRSPFPIPPSEIDSLAKKYRAFGIQIDYSPTKTLQIDLTQSLNQILKQMKKDARYEIRKAENNSLNILVSQYLPAEASAQAGPNILISNFISMWHKNALRRGFWIPFKKEIRSIYEALDKNAYLLLTYHLPRSGKLCLSRITYHEPLAGALILISGKTASYFHAASTPEGRQLSAPYLVVWEAIKLAKENGCQIFDFEGIYDERFPIKSWQGFTHFKKSFGGKEIKYPGAFIKFYNPVIKLFSKCLFMGKF